MQNFDSDMKAKKANSALFFSQTTWWFDALKRIEKIIPLKNAFEQRKKKPGLKFNPGLALIPLRTTGSLSLFRLTFLLTALCHQAFLSLRRTHLGPALRVGLR